MADDLQTEPWLHIYAQHTNHAPATIRGTKEGLIALRDALSAAIDNGKGEGTAYTSDGEGYPIEVQRVNVLNLLGCLPYTERMMDEGGDPWWEDECDAFEAEDDLDYESHEWLAGIEPVE